MVEAHGWAVLFPGLKKTLYMYIRDVFSELKGKLSAYNL